MIDDFRPTALGGCASRTDRPILRAEPTLTGHRHGSFRDASLGYPPHLPQQHLISAAVALTAEPVVDRRRLGFGRIEVPAEAHAEGLEPRVLRVHGQILADDARVADDHGVIVPRIGPRAPHLGMGAEVGAEIALDLVALADVHPDPVHDLHVFRVDPADRVGREGPSFAPDADDRFGAGLGSGRGGERQDRQRRQGDQPTARPDQLTDGAQGPLSCASGGGEAARDGSAEPLHDRSRPPVPAIDEALASTTSKEKGRKSDSQYVNNARPIRQYQTLSMSLGFSVTGYGAAVERTSGGRLPRRIVACGGEVRGGLDRVATWRCGFSLAARNAAMSAGLPTSPHAANTPPMHTRSPSRNSCPRFFGLATPPVVQRPQQPGVGSICPTHPRSRSFTQLHRLSSISIEPVAPFRSRTATTSGGACHSHATDSGVHPGPAIALSDAPASIKACNTAGFSFSEAATCSTFARAQLDRSQLLKAHQSCTDAPFRISTRTTSGSLVNCAAMQIGDCRFSFRPVTSLPARMHASTSSALAREKKRCVFQLAQGSAAVSGSVASPQAATNVKIARNRLIGSDSYAACAFSSRPVSTTDRIPELLHEGAHRLGIAPSAAIPDPAQQGVRSHDAARVER